MTKITTAEQFCHDILYSTIKRAKPLVNIFMALGSETTARNPTQLSLSPFFQYHYSIIGKVTKEFGEQLNTIESLELKSELHQTFFEKLPVQSTYKTSTDFTTVRKPEFPTLARRGFVNIPNVRIDGNKPIDIGYYISCLNLHQYDEAHPVAWSIPLDNLRVDVDADKIAVAVGQLSTLLKDEKLPFAKSQKIVNTADSGFTVPEFIAPLVEDSDNLLLINRIRYGMKVLSVAMTRKGAKRLFSTFDIQPFKPQESKNGLGQKKVWYCRKKTKHPPSRKHKNKQNYKQKIEQIK